MVCEPSEAKNHQCCSMQKRCDGPACMAWRPEMKQQTELRKSHLPLPPQFAPTGKGYCGLAHR